MSPDFLHLSGRYTFLLVLYVTLTTNESHDTNRFGVDPYSALAFHLLFQPHTLLCKIFIIYGHITLTVNWESGFSPNKAFLVMDGILKRTNYLVRTERLRG